MMNLVLRTIEPRNEPCATDIDGDRRFSIAIGNSADRDRVRGTHPIGYWRVIGAENTDLLSIEIDCQTGTLYAVELLLFTGRAGRCDTRPVANRRLQGTPIFDVARWNEFANRPLSHVGPSLIDVPASFQLHTGPAGTEIRLREDAFETLVVLDSDMEIGLDAANQFAGLYLPKVRLKY